MKPAMLRTGWKCRKLAPSVLALALAALIGGLSIAPAQAQDSDWNRRHQVQRNHDNRYHDRNRGREYQYRSYERPAYVYSPPPVYYAPPPGPPVIDFVFPLHFR
jgi:hypothetical protein